jgi:2-polyprenyl-3-methyl-5-hydroxy-6-metoxy-1,4-benzoquinol methylase
MTGSPATQMDALFTDAAPGWASRYEARPSLIARLDTVGTALRRELRARANGAGAPRVLDFGTGGGVFAAVASDLAGSVVCMDRSEAMLRSPRTNRDTLARLARGLGGEYRPERLHPVLGDDGSLRGIRGGVFDVILAVAVLEYVPSPSLTLAELVRCLSPGGVLLAAVPNPRSVLRRVEPPLNAAAARLAPRFRSARLGGRAVTGAAWNTTRDILGDVVECGGTVSSVTPIPLAPHGIRRHVRPNHLVTIRRTRTD